MNNIAKMDEVYDGVLRLTQDLSNDGHEGIAKLYERNLTRIYDQFLEGMTAEPYNNDNVMKILDELFELVDQLEKTVRLNRQFKQIRGNYFE